MQTAQSLIPLREVQSLTASDPQGGVGPAALELAAQLLAETTGQEIPEDQLIQKSSTLVRLVNRIFTDAMSDKVSDIHIESNTGRNDTKIRFRRDGILVEYLTVPYRFRNALVSRIKIMAQLDITDRRKPQDGNIDLVRHGFAWGELRVTVIPTRDGLEDMVLRVLADVSARPLEELGLDYELLHMVQWMIDRPQGLILVCGPTGSGKTTTLHALLGHLNTGERKIWTAEDPIEITQTGLRQVQVNSRIGWTFAAALRSFLRADPDVVMVGEMRDFETAKIGVEASLTGHLVLSTLHTNSAVECVTRLLDIGIDPFGFSDAVIGIVSQRLVRRLCWSCREAYTASGAEIDELEREFSEELHPGSCDRGEHVSPGAGWVTLWRAKGCPECSFRGYRGRIPVYEVLQATPDVKTMIQRRSSVAEMRTKAIAQGMRTLKQDGIKRVLLGQTDIKQVRAACG